MIKIYQKQPIQAEQFKGASDSAKHLGVEDLVKARTYVDRLIRFEEAQNEGNH